MSDILGYKQNQEIRKVSTRDCKFKVGDTVTLIRPLETRYGEKGKRVTFKPGTSFVIGGIKVRYRDMATNKNDAYELYSFALADNNGNVVAEVGQYMFDDCVASIHAEKVKELKKTCTKYKCIIGARTLLDIIILLSAIIIIMVGMTQALMSNSFEHINVGDMIVIASLVVIFISLRLLENIKYPKGLERTLMDKAKTKAKFVYCTYDYDSMTVSN